MFTVATSQPDLRSCIGVVSDFPEEKWPSMDLVADMLLHKLGDRHGSSFHVERLCPPFTRRFTRLPLVGAGKLAYTADRSLNRFFKYPQWLEARRQCFQLFHVVDHSYGHLVHHLPSDRTVVTCHDLDAFRCLMDKDPSARSVVLRTLARRILGGMRLAAHIFCDSRATRDELVGRGWVRTERVSVINIGVHPACSPAPNPAADAEAERLLTNMRDHVKILHVGSTIPRKRIDVLVRVFADLKRGFPNIALVRVGGPFTPSQQALVRDLGLQDSVVVLPFLTRPVLAAVYRKAALLVLPSEREGFGLPAVEAMACGTPVVLSNIPVLREVGGDAALYAPVADVRAFADAARTLLREAGEHSPGWQRRRYECVSQGEKFSWSHYVDQTAAVYRELLSQRGGEC